MKYHVRCVGWVGTTREQVVVLCAWGVCVVGGGGGSFEKERERGELLGEEKGTSRERMCTVRRGTSQVLLMNNNKMSYESILCVLIFPLCKASCAKRCI